MSAGAVQAVAAVGKPTTSGLPVPRFVSLKAGRVNVRVGPGEDYKIAWIFTKPGLPIEVVQEYDKGAGTASAFYTYGGGIGYRIGTHGRVGVDAELSRRSSERDDSRAFRNHRILALLTWGVLNP